MTAAAANGSSKEGLAPILVGLAIGLFLPLGLFLLWRHPTLGKNGKWWAAGIAWACFLVLMGSRAEKDDPEAPVPNDKTAEATGGDLPPAKGRNRKIPEMKVQMKEPERQQAYKDGFMEGVEMAHRWLDDIEAQAGGMDVKKFLSTNPAVSAEVEEQSFSLVRQSGERAGEIGSTLQALASSGVMKNINQHPEVINAQKRHSFMLGKSHGFNAVMDPLLSDK